MNRIIFLILLLSASGLFFRSTAAVLPKNLPDNASQKTDLMTLKPFNKVVKYALIIGGVALPIGLLTTSLTAKTGLAATFLEIGGGLLGLGGLLLLSFGLLFWLGRWLVRRHARLPKEKQKWQWLFYVLALLLLVLLGFLLVLEVPFWF